MKLERLVPYRLKLHLLNKKFHKKFQTKISAANLFDIDKILGIGHHCYGPIHVLAWRDNSDEGLIIGNFVSIADNVKFILGGNHAYDHFLTYPLEMDFPELPPHLHSGSRTKGKIVIEDDVWIGSSVTVLSGVRIGQGAILGAGAVVTKDVPPYAIVAGNPAEVKKYRFDQATIDAILKYIPLKDWDKEHIFANADLLNRKFDQETLTLLKERIHSEHDQKD